MKRTYVGWTTREQALLRKHYGAMSRDELLVILAPHSWQSIQSRASILRIRRRPASPDWAAVCAAHVMQTSYFRSLR